MTRTVRELVEFLSSDEIDQDAMLLAEAGPDDTFTVEAFYALTSKQGTDGPGYVMLLGYDND